MRLIDRRGSTGTGKEAMLMKTMKNKGYRKWWDLAKSLLCNQIRERCDEEVLKKIVG